MLDKDENFQKHPKSISHTNYVFFKIITTTLIITTIRDINVYLREIKEEADDSSKLVQPLSCFSFEIYLNLSVLFTFEWFTLVFAVENKNTNLSYNGNEELKMSNEERLVDVQYNCKEVDPCLFCRNQGKCINQHWKRCKPNLKPAFFSQFTKKKD